MAIRAALRRSKLLTKYAMAPARRFCQAQSRVWPGLGAWIWLGAAACQPVDITVFTGPSDPPAAIPVTGGERAEPEPAGRTTPSSAEGGAGAGPRLAGRGGAGGQPSIVVPPDPPLDPKIHFDWTETAPHRGPCGPGKFTGIFSCEVSSPLFVLLYTHVEGSLELTFEGSSEAPRLTITMGALRASDNTAREFLNATVVGDLNCGTRVVDAELLRTVTAVLPLERQLFWLLPFQQPSTTGWLRGNLDPLGKVINGDLSLMFETQTYCDGTFAVTTGP